MFTPEHLLPGNCPFEELSLQQATAHEANLVKTSQTKERAQIRHVWSRNNNDYDALRMTDGSDKIYGSLPGKTREFWSLFSQYSTTIRA